MKHLFATLLFSVLGLPAYGDVTLFSGDTYDWNFSLEEGGSPFAIAQFDHFNKLDLGESLQIEFYENRTEDPPLLIQKVNGSLHGLNGFAFLDLAAMGFFPDKEGIYVVRMLNGTVDLRNLYVASSIDGVNHFASHSPVPVPEPASAVLLFSSLSFAYALFLRRRPRRPER